MHSLSQEFKIAPYLLHAHLCTSPHADVTFFNQLWISVKSTTSVIHSSSSSKEMGRGLVKTILFIMDQILKSRTLKSGLRGAQRWPLRPLRSAPRPELDHQIDGLGIP